MLAYEMSIKLGFARNFIGVTRLDMGATWAERSYLEIWYLVTGESDDKIW
jgi:hypothetical protein